MKKSKHPRLVITYKDGSEMIFYQDGSSKFKKSRVVAPENRVQVGVTPSWMCF